jgi:hypothetical protein
VTRANERQLARSIDAGRRLCGLLLVLAFLCGWGFRLLEPHSHEPGLGSDEHCVACLVDATPFEAPLSSTGLDTVRLAESWADPPDAPAPRIDRFVLGPNSLRGPPLV